MALKIIRAGLQTSVPDLGRHGWRQLGISLCGVLDQPALYRANLLLGNAATAPALEIILGQLAAQFAADGFLALTGADLLSADGWPTSLEWLVIQSKRVSV